VAVNRYRNHLVIFLEDDPYRSILNGIKNLLNVNDNVLDVKNPSGGWGKVFEDFENNLYLLRKYSQCFIVLLMDFDDKDKKLAGSFESRKKMFIEKVPLEYKERVFLLGVNHKESENLKQFFNNTNFENIGAKLVEDCPNNSLSNWKNTHLECNLSEIDRMHKKGIFNWLFNS